MRIALINNIPSYWGAGKYAFMLHKELKKKFLVDHVYLNYEDKSIEINGAILRQVGASNKVIFLKKAINFIPKYDIYHFTNQNLSFLTKKRKSIVTCHDIYPYLFPKNLFEKCIRAFLYSGLKRAERIIADSENTKNDLVKYFKIDPDKIVVIYLGVSNEFKNYPKDKARKKLALPKSAKIIMHIGEVEAKRKNTKRVFRTFLRLSEKIDNLYLLRIGKGEIRHDRVINLYKISDEEMIAAYNASDVLLFPSLYEGFGLPPLEAMKCGLPVVTSTATSLPEIAGGAAILVNPYNEIELEEAVYKILTNERLRKDLIRRGLERAKLYTWKSCAARVSKIYEMLR